MLDIEVWGGNDEVGLELDNVNLKSVRTNHLTTKKIGGWEGKLYRRVREARKGRIVPVSDGDGDNASEWIGV